MFKKIMIASIISITALSLTACGQQPKAETVTMPQETALSAEGVLTAAVVLSTGDVDAAVASGKITPAEVEAAKKAIQTNTLNEWRVKAEAELKK